MPLYECKICNLKTNLLGNFKQHLNTVKHIKKKQYLEENKGMSTNEHKMSTKNVKMSPNEHKMSTKTIKNNEKWIKKNEKPMTQYMCCYCDMTFMTKANKRRHEIHYCKENTSLIDKRLKEKDKKIKVLKRDKAILRKEIEVLLTKVGNTTNNNNNNFIIVNNFGNENMDYISDDFLKKITKGPYGAITKLLKTIHFHPEFPENHNIKITNKKLPYASVWNKENWETRDKKTVIDSLVDKGYSILDCEAFNHKLYSIFKTNYESNAKVGKEIEKDAELMVINESKRLEL